MILSVFKHHHLTLSFGPHQPKGVNEPTSVTVSPMVSLDWEGKPPLNFFMILMPLFLVYSWWLVWMVFPLSPSVEHSPLVGPPALHKTYIPGCPTSSHPLFLLSSSSKATQDFFPLCYMLHITFSRLLRVTLATSLGYSPGLPIRILILYPKKVPPNQWILPIYISSFTF